MIEDFARQWKTRTWPLASLVDQRLVPPVGSCFVVGQGYFVSCAHLWQDGREHGTYFSASARVDPWPVTHQFTSGHYLPLERVVYDTTTDLMLLRLRADSLVQFDFSLVPLNITTEAKVGATVGYVGYPFAHLGRLNPTLSVGIISSTYTLDYYGRGVKTIQVGGMAAEGNSGSPLFSTTTGSLVGVMTRRFDPNAVKARKLGASMLNDAAVYTNIAMATSISHLFEFVDREQVETHPPSHRKIAIGDRISILVDQLSVQTSFLVNSLGRICFPFLGEFVVAGRTVAEVASTVEKLLVDRQLAEAPTVQVSFQVLAG